MPHEPSVRVPCPECGAQFIPRGLASHRRQRHGVIPAPLPAAPAPETSEILSALQLLRGAVERIDERIGDVEAVTLHKETREEEIVRLESELAGLLDVINRIQHPPLPDGAVAPAAPLPNAELGRLRLEQARLVFRIDELRTGTPNAERFLT